MPHLLEREHLNLLFAISCKKKKDLSHITNLFICQCGLWIFIFFFEL